MRKIVITVAMLALLAPAAAFAQGVEWNVGGGVTFPSGKIADEFDTGWNGEFGVTFNASPAIGFQAEYGYMRFGGPDRQFTNLAPTPQDGDGLLTIESNHQMHIGTFNLVARSHGSGSVSGYVLAGPGIYHRIVQLTSPGVGYATVCDPYWLVCYPTAVSTTQILGDRSSNDFGMNFGGGLAFGRGAKFYVEARYHYVWGPKITPSATPVSGGATTYSSNASYIPITFGFRF